MKSSKCIRIASRLLQGSLCLLLFGQLSLLLCYFVYGYIPIPTSLANQLLEKASIGGYQLSATNFQLSLRGDLNVEGLSVKSADFSQPIISAKFASIDFDWFHSLEQLTSLDKIVVSGGTLFLPASISPEGVRSEFLEKAAFRIIYQADRIQIDSIAAKLSDIKLRGSIELPRKPSDPDDASAPLKAAELFTLIRSINQEINRFDFLSAPTITFRIEMNAENRLLISTKLSSQSLNHANFTGKHFRLESDFCYMNQNLTAQAPAFMYLDHLDIPELELHAVEVSAYIAQENWQDLMQKQWPTFEFSAESITWASKQFTTPYLRFTSTDYPVFNFDGSAKLNESIAAFKGRINPLNRSGDVKIKGMFDFTEHLPQTLTAHIPSIEYLVAPYVQAQLSFDPNFSLKNAEAMIQAEGLSISTIQFDHIRANVAYTPESFQVSDALIQRNGQWVDLTFQYGIQSNQYGVSLVGSAIPYEYNALLPSWWAVIFQDLDFSETTDSLGDFIIYGNTKKSVADLFFGYARANHIKYNQVPVDSGSLFVRGRDHYVELDQIDATNREGRATGKIAFTSLDDGIHDLASIRYTIDGQISIEHAQAIFGGSVADILSDFKMPQAPEVHLVGAFFTESYPELTDKSFYTLTASAPQSFTFKETQIDALTFSLTGNPTRTALRDIHFRFADGTGSGAIDIWTPSNGESALNFDLNIKNADKDLTTQYLTYLQDESEPKAANIPGKIDLSIRAKGPASDPFKYSGNGQLKMRSQQLGAIQLLGPLSRILQHTRLGFTSLVLDELKADFTLNQQVIDFQKIEINGPQTRIYAKGALTLPEQTLDMKVTANLIANIGEPDSGFRKFSDVLNPFLKPIPNLLSFNLTGSLDDQKWRSTYDPRNLIELF